jgi:aspartate-semialdehyde dehydrogenase
LADSISKKTNGAAERSLVAIVGGDSLLARELRDLLSRSTPAPRVQLIAGAIETGPAAAASAILTEQDNEAAVMVPLTAENLEGAQTVFLAGTAATSRRAQKIAPKNARLIDLSSGLEDQPGARLRAPQSEPSTTSAAATAIQVIAHPAAIALAMFLVRLAEISPIRRSVIHVFEPASERGQRGIEELQQQTVAVLSFQKMKTDVFDTQLAFNVLAQYGEEALEPLENVEQRLEKHLASLLAAHPGVPMPSLRLIQAPVFHGHSSSIWIEFEKNPGAETVMSSLSSAGFDVRPDEPPSNAGIAGVSGLAIGAISVDRNHPNACWIWMVADNLRLAAENALAVAKETMI